MSNDTIRHVVGYARVSTRDQDLSSQVERIQRYISDYGLIPAIEGAIFQEKISGISNQRPERTKIMRLAEHGKIDLVICTCLIVSLLIFHCHTETVNKGKEQGSVIALFH